MPKISELNTISNTSTSDLMVLVKDISGAPSTNKISVGNFMTYASKMGAYASNTELGGIKVGENLTINSTGYLSATQNPGELPTSGQENGYVLQWSNEENAPLWTPFSTVYQYSSVNQSNTYNVTADDYILFVDPNNYGGDIYINLPTTPVVGKVYQIKNINPGDGFSVIVVSGDHSSIIEHPETGEFLSSFIISNKGDSQEWVFDGAYYRHIGSQSYIPFFSSSANTFTELAVRNLSSGENASADISAYNDLGDPAEGNGPYVDMGINSSQYANIEYSLTGPSDSYLYSTGGNLIIGTQDPGANLVLHAGGTTLETYHWTFSDNNRLTFPDGDYISQRTWNSQTSIGLNASDGTLSSEFYTSPSSSIINSQNFTTSQYAEIRVTSSSGDVMISTSDGGPSTDWVFNLGGTLTFPNGSIQSTAYTEFSPEATNSSNSSSVGYLGMPQNSKSNDYQLSISDMGKHIYMATSNTVTIPSFSSVDFPVGSVIDLIAGSGATVTIEITTDTLYLAGAGTTGSRTLSEYGMAKLVKVSQSSWFINGIGLT